MVKCKLDDKNIGLTKILFDLKQSLDLYKLIALNASEINAKGTGKSFFATTQRLAIKSYVIDICKIFEEKKRYELNSIPEILTFIQEKQIIPIDFDPIKDFAIKNGITINQNSNYFKELNYILDNFLAENKEDFKRYKAFRDKKIAHTEDTKDRFDTLPSYDVMEKLLFFAIDFYEMIHEAYIGGIPVNHKNDKRCFDSLHKLLGKVGHNDIKVDFDRNEEEEWGHTLISDYKQK